MDPADSSQEVDGSWAMVCRGDRRLSKALGRGKSTDKSSSGDDHKTDQPREIGEQPRPGEDPARAAEEGADLQDELDAETFALGVLKEEYVNTIVYALGETGTNDFFVSLGQAPVDVRSLNSHVELQMLADRNQRVYAVNVVHVSTGEAVRKMFVPFIVNSNSNSN